MVIPTAGWSAVTDDATDSDPALELATLTRRFGGLVAVDEVSLRVNRRTIFGLLGPNGAGKTTILNLISGFDRPTSGSLRLFGKDITSKPPHEVARQGVARTYQNVRLFHGMSALENVAAGRYSRRTSRLWQSVLCMPSELRERREVLEDARALLDRVGMTLPVDRLAETLPYAEQRRVEIARALASRPNLLLLDEPTAGMNSTESAAIGDLLITLRDGEGLTLVLIEHNIKLVLAYCDEAVVLNFGRKIASGTPRSCVDNPDVRIAYFGRRGHA
jgi:branched-chain amino acid transport system ATP-binding protein